MGVKKGITLLLLLLSLTTTTLAIQTSLPEDAFFGQEEGMMADVDWMRLLINRDKPLAADYLPPALADIGFGHRVDSRMADPLHAMMEGARSEGFDPLILSSYRTEETQTRLYRNKVRYYRSLGRDEVTAEEQAAFWVARPGESEHQAGLAVDIVARDYQALNAKQAEQPLQQWLAEHCAEYGFIRRYAPEKSDITGVGGESWHYRYVGQEAAQVMVKESLCLEEYLQQGAGSAWLTEDASLVVMNASLRAQ